MPEALRPGQLAGEVERGQIAVGEDGEHAAAVGGGRGRGVAGVVVHLRAAWRCSAACRARPAARAACRCRHRSSRPRGGVLSAPERNTRLPQTTGELLPGSGTGVFQTMLLPDCGVPRVGHVRVGRDAQPAGPAESRPRLGDLLVARRRLGGDGRRLGRGAARRLIGDRGRSDGSCLRRFEIAASSSPIVRQRRRRRSEPARRPRRPCTTHSAATAQRAMRVHAASRSCGTEHARRRRQPAPQRRGRLAPRPGTRRTATSSRPAPDVGERPLAEVLAGAVADRVSRICSLSASLVGC